jgi:hypothetical protein
MPRKNLPAQRKILSWKTILPAVGLGLAGLFTPWLRLPNPVKAFFGFFVGGSLGYYISGNSASKESAAELQASKNQQPLLLIHNKLFCQLYPCNSDKRVSQWFLYNTLQLGKISLAV